MSPSLCAQGSLYGMGKLCNPRLATLISLTSRPFETTFRLPVLILKAISIVGDLGAKASITSLVCQKYTPME